MELPFVFLSGLLGSSHCIGMCGGFAVIIGVEQTNHTRNLLVQLVYSVGRISTYVFLGAMAGLLGMTLTADTRLMRNVPAALCVFAGLFLIVEGMAAVGFRWRKTKGTSSGGCFLGSQFASLLRGGRLENAFAAGILTGFLPCGLVYAFLSLAASTTSIAWGAVLMGIFGLGTVPLMVITGIGASFMSVVARRHMMKLAAWCVVATGCLTMARGATFVQFSDDEQAVECPLCVEVESPER